MKIPRYTDLPTGRFEHVDDLKTTLIRTSQPGWWTYRPDSARPMRFVRPNGEVIQPEEFITDLGTIPRWLRIGRLLQPDAIPAVALVHDWIVRQNNCGAASHSFEQSNLIQQEALKTWMEAHPKDRSLILFYLSRFALGSKRSRRGWDFRFKTCPPTLQDILQARRRL